jgi:hypothetical protein
MRNDCNDNVTDFIDKDISNYVKCISAILYSWICPSLCYWKHHPYMFHFWKHFSLLWRRIILQNAFEIRMKRFSEVSDI